MFLFGVRGFATGFFQVIGLYTPEVINVFYVSVYLCMSKAQINRHLVFE